MLTELQRQEAECISLKTFYFACRRGVECGGMNVVMEGVDRGIVATMKFLDAIFCVVCPLLARVRIVQPLMINAAKGRVLVGRAEGDDCMKSETSHVSVRYHCPFAVL